MYWITFLRHGESAGNANGQIQGQSDPPLTEKGLLQAANLARRWVSEGRRYDQIISSPLNRAYQTAKIISSELKLAVDTDPTWMERGFGIMEGMDYAELVQEMPALDLNHPYRAPAAGAESIVDVYNRASLAVQSLLLQPPGAYLVVSHGALLNMAMYAILGVSPHSSPASPRFIIQNTGFVDLLYNPAVPQWRLLRFFGDDPTFG